MNGQSKLYKAQHSFGLPGYAAVAAGDTVKLTDAQAASLGGMVVEAAAADGQVKREQTDRRRG